MRRKCLNQGIIKRISKELGDTYDGLTGTEIQYFLKLVDIQDVSPSITKWKRLYDAFVTSQNELGYSNKILRFIGKVMEPSRYPSQEAFEIKRKVINEALAYVGYHLKSDGQFKEVEQASTINEAQRRANSLLEQLKIRNIHPEIFKYCTAELLDSNYFHAVFEACKGLFARIRSLSYVNTDGVQLVQYVFNHPVLVINKYHTRQEKDEQKGFEAILEGICNMFRNPESHQPKIEWPVEEQDAIEILSLLSYCHRRLDKAERWCE